MEQESREGKKHVGGGSEFSAIIRDTQKSKRAFLGKNAIPTQIKAANIKAAREFAIIIKEYWARMTREQFAAARRIGAQPTQTLDLVNELKLPKVNEKDKILVFAGHVGSVSGKISNGTQFHSDIDSVAVRLARRRYFLSEEAKYRHFLAADALSLPIKPLSVDWLFSFEPSFLMADFLQLKNPSPAPIGKFFIPGAVSIPSKGIMIAAKPGSEDQKKAYALLNLIINTYTVNSGLSLRTLDIEDANKKEKRIFLMTLLVGDLMRLEAKVDAEILKGIEELEMKKPETSDFKIQGEPNIPPIILNENELENIREKLKLDLNSFSNSLYRLKMLRLLDF